MSHRNLNITDDQGILDRLPRGEVHCWILPLAIDESLHAQTVELLNARQRDHYSRRKDGLSKHRYLAGRYILYRLLAHYLNRPIEQIQLNYSRLGKPSVIGEPIQFNFSDTYASASQPKSTVPGYIALAFSQQRVLGIDIENTNRRINGARIADDKFTKQELEYCTINGELDKAKFLEIWTRKEAYGKANAVGINFAMNGINLVQGNEPSFSIKEQDRSIHAHSFAAPASHIVSVIELAGLESGASQLKHFNNLTLIT